MDLHLAFHALIVLLGGLLSGIPMGQAINREDGEDRVRAWRVAHSGLCMGGLMLLIFAMMLTQLEVGSWLRLLILGASLCAGYGFLLALPYGAAKGARGTQGGGSRENRLVYLGNKVGAWGSLIATLGLLVAVAVRLFQGGGS